MGFAKTALAHGKLWFGKEKYERVQDEEALIPDGYLVTHSLKLSLCCDQLPLGFRNGGRLNSQGVGLLDT